MEMERTHSRDWLMASKTAPSATIQITAPREATSDDDSLVRRGFERIARPLALVPRKDCIENASVNTCEKPAVSSSTALGIIIAIGVVGALIVVGILVFLHLRRQKRDQLEFANDPHELSDYGIDEPTPAKKRGGGASRLQPPVQENRLSAQELMGRGGQHGGGQNNPFSDEASTSGRSAASAPPPKYPGDAHTKE